MRNNTASLTVTVPSKSEAKAPMPAAKPKFMPLGRLIIRKNVTATIVNDIAEA
jgi:hypothetical protein